MNPEADKALEEKARSLFAMLDSNLGVAIEVSSVWEIRQRIIAALREVAEQARREEAAEWERAIESAGHGSYADGPDGTIEAQYAAEILRRRGVK